ncbi:14640_t:CDS:2 [Racocetra fulgida]|uniref:14640_t:CDS:1 n=1 Tax=Racocetra fulgida TaxID=60492 RepID=A0A9N8ZLM1_9GLOM|nr:14640_t:CDS:2 [Racocetra fulgida]
MAKLPLPPQPAKVEPIKNNPKKWHIRDDPITWQNWYKHINWLHTSVLLSTPFIALYGFFTTDIQLKTWTDTELDPYNAHRGFFYSHLGWMLLKQNPYRIGRADISDLSADPLIMFQGKYYGVFALVLGFIFPTIVAGYGWGDWRGGFYYAAIARLVFVHHATFCVNSLAHYFGDKPFDDRNTPRDHFITAILSLGEGQLIMKQKKLDEEKKKLNWGVPLDQLPIYTFDEFSNNWICIEGVIHDVSSFMDEHPGGRTILATSLGKDVTTAFNGGVYGHSNAARNLMSSLRVGVISGGGEVESRKKKQ